MASPLVITARLAGPIIDGGDPIHLDGLLALAWVRRHAQHARRLDRKSGSSDVAAAHLPLLRLSALGESCWVASAGIPSDDDRPAAVWQTRRRDHEDWDRLDRPVNTTAGPSKDVLMRRSGRVATSMTWLAWGDRHEVRASLRLLLGAPDSPHGFIGSSRRSGAGEIESWSLDRGEHSLMDCLVCDGAAMRHLPVSWLSSCSQPRIGAHRPPYWLPVHRGRVCAVGSSVELIAEVDAAVEEEHAVAARALRIGESRAG